ncbi:MAG: DUF115 domain-containing protein [Spirochaetaceae bacterium]|jgi:hypothetical protein|nr:DUF115 domain-containing protein [Spirochaetaceae bacterium]
MQDEIPRRVEARRGFSVAYRGKTLLSVLDPIAQADRIVLKAHKTGRTLYVCPSPLLGYGLSTILQTMSDDSALLCVETDENLMAFSLAEMDRAVLAHPAMRFVRARDSETLCAYVRSQWGERSFRRVELLRLGGGWQLDTETYETLAGALRRTIAVDWGNAATLIRLGRLYARNAVRNLALLPESGTIDDLDFGSGPALVLGAGPSLDRTLEELKDLCVPERRFKIICVDTALSALNSFSIVPDLVVALEAQHWNIGDFIGSRGRNIPLALDLSALPGSGSLLGPRFFFSTPWAPLAFFERLREYALLPPGLPPLGSVGLSAAALALKISTGPVLTGGLDFSFELDGFHAKAAPPGIAWLCRQNRLSGFINAGAAIRRGTFTALSKEKKRVLSTINLKNYRDLFEEEFGGEKRMGDLLSSGLPLGLPVLNFEEARTLLSGAADIRADIRAGSGAEYPGGALSGGKTKKDRIIKFIEQELSMLRTIRAVLTGEGRTGKEEFGRLLDACDYLWTHFPECAGAGGKRPRCAKDDEMTLSFLKRVRAELDPFIVQFELTERLINAM